MIDILEAKIVKLRKPCKCWGCRREFQAGQTIRKTTSVDEGVFAHAAWCEVCEAVMDTINEVDKDLGFCEGELKNGDPDYWERIRGEIEG